MNVIIKMLDADNKGFRLLTVVEPVDIQVKPYNPPSFLKPTLVVTHGPANKHYEINGNVYIMNEAGDTISKVDFEDVSKGMLELNTQLIEAFAESGLTAGIKPIRELGPVHIDDSENRDFGVLLKHWDKEGDEIGGYFDGYFKTLEHITAVMIRQFKAYAKPDIIEEIRKLEVWPELKIKMLVDNDKLVNPPLVVIEAESGTVTLHNNGATLIASPNEINVKFNSVSEANLQSGYWKQMFGHLNEKTADLAMAFIMRLLDMHPKEDVGAVVSGSAESAHGEHDNKLWITLNGDPLIVYSVDSSRTVRDVSRVINSNAPITDPVYLMTVQHLKNMAAKRDPNYAWYSLVMVNEGVKATPVIPETN